MDTRLNIFTQTEEVEFIPVSERIEKRCLEGGGWIDSNQEKL